MVYYNEVDKFCVQWLKNLIEAGHIAKGEVDDRSIVDVRPNDLKGYKQCHFFSGIGIWSYALRLAGVPDDFECWTGSCPCQPFSAAGKGKGKEDERHLWPEWFRLIRECKPPVLFGEQVAAAIGHGWLDSLQSDMEGEGYAIGKAILGACSVGAPHIRQRLYFVGNAHDASSARIGEHGGKILSREESERLRVRRLVGGFWGNDTEWLWCRDQKFRPTQSGLFPLAHGNSRRVGRVRSNQEPAAEIPRKDQGSRVGRLKAYGNAIVPQVAAEFIRAYMETI